MQKLWPNKIIRQIIILTQPKKVMKAYYILEWKVLSIQLYIRHY